MNKIWNEITIKLYKLKIGHSLLCNIAVTTENG